jgi:hypothetical protein
MYPAYYGWLTAGPDWFRGSGFQALHDRIDLAAAMICASSAMIEACNALMWPSRARSAVCSPGIAASSAATSALSSANPRPPRAATSR